MTKPNAGFTLIETVVVMAVLGLLFVIVFIGSTELQDRARFDTSIDQLVQDVAYAKNYAASYVNEVGPGNSSAGIQAGAGFELDNNHAMANEPLTEVKTLYGQQDAGGNLNVGTIGGVWPPLSPITDNTVCAPANHPADNDECQEDFLNLPDKDIIVTQVNGQPRPNVAVYYVQTGLGLKICHDTGVPSWRPVYQACATFDTNPIDIGVKDTATNYTATIEIDPSTGVAKRL
jgi:prepilin-type N-terminal cleavage/methylation domain-containing protein